MFCAIRRTCLHLDSRGGIFDNPSALAGLCLFVLWIVFLSGVILFGREKYDIRRTTLHFNRREVAVAAKVAGRLSPAFPTIWPGIVPPRAVESMDPSNLRCRRIVVLIDSMDRRDD